MIAKLVSGGQTGVDRAGLDAALELGIPVGGWRHKGRKAEDGRIPDRYPLTETPGADYPTRTRWDVRDSDFTPVLTEGEPSGGALLTVREAQRQGRRHAVADLVDKVRLPDELVKLRSLLTHVRVLTWAGRAKTDAPASTTGRRRFCGGC